MATADPAQAVERQHVILLLDEDRFEAIPTRHARSIPIGPLEKSAIM
jgi:hypothetical protein